MIRLCTCGKFLGFKAVFTGNIKHLFSKTHGLCQDCFEKQLFKIPGYLNKWLKYNGWKQGLYGKRQPVLDPLERILATFIGVMIALLIATYIW